MLDVYHSVVCDDINSNITTILCSEFMLQCLYFININIFFTCSDSCEKQMPKNIIFDNFCFRNIVMTYCSNVDGIVRTGASDIIKTELSCLELIVATLIGCIGSDALKTVNKIMIHFSTIFYNADIT